jgi:hypothetical protein
MVQFKALLYFNHPVNQQRPHPASEANLSVNVIGYFKHWLKFHLIIFK